MYDSIFKSQIVFVFLCLLQSGLNSCRTKLNIFIHSMFVSLMNKTGL